MQEHAKLIEPLLARLRSAGSGATYPLDPVERELVLAEIDRLRGERDKPALSAFDQVEKILRYYASQPYADSANETVRVRCVLLVTAATLISQLRATLQAVETDTSGGQESMSDEVRQQVAAILEQTKDPYAQPPVSTPI